MPGDSIITAFQVACNAIPGAYIYGNLGQAGLSVQPKLKAAALCAYLPSLPDPFGRPVGALLKLASMVAMAGNYCDKTFMVDYKVQPVGTPQCVSGTGACNGWFAVRAPALVPGHNTYELIIPNCKCS